MTIAWTSVAPAVSAAFLSSLVEAVEALTIVLAVATVRGWRPAGLGALAGLASLALIVLALGPLLDRVPLHALQLAIGVLLLLFGMRWLRKAILRAAGVIPLHDEELAFATGTAALREQAHHGARLDWLAGLAAYKAMLLEGLEVRPAPTAMTTNTTSSPSRRCFSRDSRWCSWSSPSEPAAASSCRRASERWRPVRWSPRWVSPCAARSRACPRTRSSSRSASCCPRSACSGPERVWACPGRARTSPSSDLQRCS